MQGTGGPLTACARSWNTVGGGLGCLVGQCGSLVRFERCHGVLQHSSCQAACIA